MRCGADIGILIVDIPSHKQYRGNRSIEMEAGRREPVGEAERAGFIENELSGRRNDFALGQKKRRTVELVRALYAIEESPKLKVIYMSGYSVEVAGKDFSMSEGVNFLTKPFQVHKLAHAVRDCLDRD